MTTDTDEQRGKIERFLAEPRNAIVGANRPSGRPQMTPNWFYFDGERFYISTTKGRRKYDNFVRDPRVALLIDDPTGFKSVMLDGTVEIWEDLEAALPYFKQIISKHGRPTPDDATLLERLTGEGRVLLVITPEKPVEAWTAWGL